MKTFCACLLVLSATATAVFADPTPVQPRTDRVAAKDPGTAVSLSLVGTVVPVSMMVVGIGLDNDPGDTLAYAGLIGSTIGPSIGHWYAGEPLTIGMALRAGGVALFLTHPPKLCFGFDDSCQSNSGEFMLAGVLYLTGTVVDLATAGRAARAWNNEHHLALAPTRIGSGPQATTGLGLSGTF
jgi:hypothetical protein